MVVAYFDSSALVKAVLAEDGTDQVRAVWNAASVCVTSWLTSAESAAALGAARRSKRLSAAAFRRATGILDEVESQLVHVQVTQSVAVLAAELAVRHSLRGADAVQLASALMIEGDPLFVCFDRRLRSAAALEGLMSSPAEVREA